MTPKEKTLEEISASMARYYDSLTDEEIAEDRDWGDFAAAQLTKEEAETSAERLTSERGMPDDLRGTS
jgi:hypothetical protein